MEPLSQYAGVAPWDSGHSVLPLAGADADGAPARRHNMARVTISCTQAMVDEEDRLSKTCALVKAAPGSHHRLSPAQIKLAIEDFFYRTIAPVRYIVSGWNRRRYSTIFPLPYLVRLFIEGMPPHAWGVGTAKQMLPDVIVHSVATESRDKVDLSYFVMTAWCNHPDDIPLECILDIEDPYPKAPFYVPNLPEGFMAAEPLLNLGSRMHCARVVSYHTLIHLDSVADYTGYEPDIFDGPGRRQQPPNLPPPKSYRFHWRRGCVDGQRWCVDYGKSLGMERNVPAVTHGEGRCYSSGMMVRADGTEPSAFVVRPCPGMAGALAVQPVLAALRRAAARRPETVSGNLLRRLQLPAAVGESPVPNPSVVCPPLFGSDAESVVEVGTMMAGALPDQPVLGALWRAAARRSETVEGSLACPQGPARPRDHRLSMDGTAHADGQKLSVSARERVGGRHIVGTDPDQDKDAQACGYSTMSGEMAKLVAALTVAWMQRGARASEAALDADGTPPLLEQGSYIDIAQQLQIDIVTEPATCMLQAHLAEYLDTLTHAPTATDISVVTRLAGLPLEYEIACSQVHWHVGSKYVSGLHLQQDLICMGL
ncbi:hypothetical protein ACP70R_001880 [Stipagrostis hirtigluma subsp. patula]